jgi:hypothetical protein
LEKQVEYIAQISVDLMGGSKKRDTLLEFKLAEAKVKNLQKALELGLITKAEFDEKARELLLKDI